MKKNWYSSHGGGFCGNFSSAKHLSAYVKQINTLVAYNVKNTLKIKKNIKARQSKTLTWKPSWNILTSKTYIPVRSLIQMDNMTMLVSNYR